MNITGTTQPEPEPPQSDHDVLVEIRDLLKKLLAAVAKV